MSHARDLVVNWLEDEASVFSTSSDDVEVGPEQSKQLKSAATILREAAEYAKSLPVDDPIYQRIESFEDYDLDGYYPNVTGQHLNPEGLANLKNVYEQPYRQLLENIAGDIEQNSKFSAKPLG